VLLFRQQHIKCLSEFFDVIVINEDCDYQQICEEYEPDLTLFESGVNNEDIHRLNIKNTHTHPMIPKVGFHNGDPWCEARAGFLSDMEQWGIETFFSISCTIAEHMPEITENLFVWPNFIDADICRDYELPKTVPILITGGVSPLYPWRQKVNKVVTRHFPSLICPHGGYVRPVVRMFQGEQYARLINASWFVPTCGTLAKEVVRKHFEIPASRSCLVTEKSPALEAAGFIDMQNCVFADEQDVLDKLDYLFQNQDKLERIIDAGYNLVHSRHTLRQRDQILQWFNLHKNLQPNQKIFQKNPFGSLTIVEKSSEIKGPSFVGNGLDISLLQKGDEELWAGKYEEAEITYIKCFNYMSRKPETKFRLALCNLYKGNVNAALYWIVQPIQSTLGDYKASDPDPVEWAYYVIALLCSGKLDEAKQHVNHFPLLRHPELDRTKWVINLLANGENMVPLQQHEGQSKYRYSIHQLPHRSLGEWIEQLCKMLNACQQTDLAETLTRSRYLSASSVKKKDSEQTSTNALLKPSKGFYSQQLKVLSFLLPKIGYPFHLSFFNTLWFLQIRKRLKLKPKILNFLNSLEARFGYFLPYYFSEMRNDEFFQAIQNLAEEEDIENILIIGASAEKGSTEALIAGLRGKQNSIGVFCINTINPRFTKLKKLHTNNSCIKFYSLSSSSLTRASDELENLIKGIKQENQIDSFDTILIDGSECDFSVDLSDELSRSRYVLLNGISTPQHCKNHSELLINPGYILVCQNPCLRRGYSIFQKVSLPCDGIVEAIDSLRESLD
jgi:hypothetical protein